MDSAEYDNLAVAEREYWYYVGKRVMVRRWIERIRPPRATDRLIDCGAGTGLFAEEMSARCSVTVMDTFDESLRLLRERFSDEQVVTLENGEIPLPTASMHYVTALDLLEHVPDDRGVVKGFARLLKPGGLAVVTVPANMALWSDWDVSLQHHRRYDRAQLIDLFDSEKWELVHANYTNVPVFPFVWLIRRWRRNPSPANDSSRMEDRRLPTWLNRLLQWQFVRLAMSWLPMPFGVSLILIARRR